MKKGLDIPAIINAIKRSLSPVLKYPVGLHEPNISGNEWNYVKDCLDSTWVSSVGKYVDKFEEMIAAFTGVNALGCKQWAPPPAHLFAAGRVEPGDEVVPALTFVAATPLVGGRPHFVDIEEYTPGLDPRKLGTISNRWL